MASVSSHPKSISPTSKTSTTFLSTKQFYTDVNETDSNGMTVLMLALVMENKDAVKI